MNNPPTIPKTERKPNPPKNGIVTVSRIKHPTAHSSGLPYGFDLGHNHNGIYTFSRNWSHPHSRTGKRDTIYQAAMMDPVTGAQLSTDQIISMCDELIAAHTAAGFPILAK